MSTASEYLEALKTALVDDVDFMFGGKYTTMGCRSTLHPRMVNAQLNHHLGTQYGRAEHIPSQTLGIGGTEAHWRTRTGSLLALRSRPPISRVADIYLPCCLRVHESTKKK